MFEDIKAGLIGRRPQFKEYMVWMQGKPHTHSIHHLEGASNAVYTAEYYFVARYLELIEDSFAVSIISELKKLQDTDENSVSFGCMRWYREEPFIEDSNGAFFVLLPLALTYKLCEEKLTEQEKADILYLLKNGAEWFVRATKGPLYYCNKIMSDGAVLALISEITGLYRTESDAFWNRWHAYADENGWGWGENTSAVYSKIMFNALNVAVLACHGDLKEKAQKRQKMLMEYIAYHEGKEFVPSIRTYNFGAKANYGGDIYNMFFRREQLLQNATGSSGPGVALQAIVAICVGAEWPADKGGIFKKEHLFRGSYAFTWKAPGIRLGSVSHFPVMPCSYMNETKGPGGYRTTYGLGWQSMPVSAMLDEEKIAFLRIRTRVNGKEYYHPSAKWHKDNLFNRVFEDGNVTVFSTRAAQDHNLAVVCRYANKPANTAEFIADEWCIPDVNTEIQEKKIGDRIWYVINGINSKLAVCPLDGIACESTSREPLKTYISENGMFKTITTEWYKGDNKLLFTPRLESVWVIAALEGDVEWESYLEKMEINDEVLPNVEIGYNSVYKRRKIVCTDGKRTVEFMLEPTEQIDF